MNSPLGLKKGDRVLFKTSYLQTLGIDAHRYLEPFRGTIASRIRDDLVMVAWENTGKVGWLHYKTLRKVGT